MPLLAEGDVTVHKLLPGGDPKDPSAAYESVTLGEGDWIGEDEVPAYVMARVKAGEAGPLVIASKTAADKAQAKAAEARKKQLEGSEEINGSNAEQDANEA